MKPLNGISSSEEIRIDNYIDKTHFIKKLLNEGKYYFRSRPCRLDNLLS
ncbi:MAG: AAA family ATPase [Candidatus Calescibacterium sp.]|nr:AAA family ATPase [Candidatus Calescibacterium sp.]MDW8133166.1 AAA family ATPase [Candidatus Calescibacterium sp.]